MRTSGFAYDIELLVALNRRGCTIAQMPVTVVYVRDKNTKKNWNEKIYGVRLKIHGLYL